MSKLTIQNEMRAIDTKDRNWYNSLTDEEQSKYNKALWTQQRYVSSCKHDIKEFEEHYLEWTNELVNVHHNTLRHHPELQFKLLQAVGVGKSMFHQWINPPKGAQQSKLMSIFSEQHPHLNDEELEIVILQYTVAEITDLLDELGYKKSEIKKILK
jgi:hypothetical protein